MAWTQADLDNLKAIRASGIREVHYADKGLSYHGDDQLAKLQKEMERDLSSQAGESGTRVTYSAFYRD